MFGRLLLVSGTALLIAVALVTPVLAAATATPASGDTVINGCTIVSNPSPTNFTNCPSGDLGGANLSGVDLSYANLSGATFVACASEPNTGAPTCSAANLSQAKLIDANLSGATFVDCFVGANETGICDAASLSSANLTGATLSSATLFSDLDIAAPHVSNLTGVEMSGAILSGANLGGVNMTEDDLTGATLTGANLDGTTLSEVNLTNANVSGANLTNATFMYCPFNCYNGGTLTGADFTGATLTGANLTGTSLIPSDQTVAAPSTGGVVTWPTPQSLPGATPGTCTPPSGSTFPLTTGSAAVVTCQVLDDRGDVATGTFTVDVVQLATITSVSSSAPSVAAVGVPVTYTVDVTTVPVQGITPTPETAGGTVSFTENGATIVGCSAVPLVEGNPSTASCTTTFQTAAPQTIAATYSGSGIFGGSANSITQIVQVAAPPTTSVLLPSNGATVTGDSWLDAGASSIAGIASVSFEVSGGSVSDQVVGTGVPTFYGYIGAWNSTSVPNGNYTIQSVATDTLGQSTTSAPVTITVNNPVDSTSMLIPTNGATLSGTALLDSGSTAGVTAVSFEVSGGSLSDQVVSASAPTIYGWLGGWNTTTVPNGTYTIQSVGTLGAGGTVTSAPITVTVSN